MLFKNIVGQERIKTHLRRTVRESQISHAQLFMGAAGYGGLPLAIAYAQYMVCENRSVEDACGECPACRKYEKLIHPDLHFVFPVAGSNKPNSDTYLSQWREKVVASPYFDTNEWFHYIGVDNKQGIISKDESYAILRKLSLKTFDSEYKVMIIWMAELMNVTAANKLLKILEEPPEKTLFILLCESTERVLPTILSRTQLIKIPSVDEASMSSYLNAIAQENQASPEQASNAVRLAHGNVVTGLQSLFSNDEQQFFLQSYITLMRLAWKPQVIELLDWADQTAGWGREQLKTFFLFVLRITRENLMMRLSQESLLRVTSEEFEFVKKFSSSVSFTALTQVAREFDLAYGHINANGNAKIILADLVLQVAKMLKMKE